MKTKKIWSLLLAVIFIFLLIIPGLTAFAVGDSSDVTGDGKSGVQSFINEAQELLSYEPETLLQTSSYDENSFEEEIDFSSCRLIVKSDREPERLNSVGIASGYRDYYLIQFENEIDAKNAYNYYTDIDYIDVGVNGTSFSSPLTASVCAEILTIYPSYTPEKLIDIIKETAVPYDYICALDGMFDIYGTGFIDAVEAVGIERVEKISSNLDGGQYKSEIILTLTAPDDAEIYYSMNNRYPTKETGILYTEPICIYSNQFIVNAVAYNDSDAPSRLFSNFYRSSILEDESNFEIDKDGAVTKYNGSLLDIVIPDTINSIEKLDKTEVDLYCDDSLKITAECESKVTWSSSAPNVAKVDQNGVVTAVGRGTATITATAENGESASCKVNVKLTWWQWILYIVKTAVNFVAGWFK